MISKSARQENRRGKGVTRCSDKQAIYGANRCHLLWQRGLAYSTKTSHRFSSFSSLDVPIPLAAIHGYPRNFHASSDYA
ncbi:hypothetical protein GIX45_00285 [Erwinia sp. CPCC 100877]|nr:hypothetical protein [Erwinia sp. CPCC 100877]